MFEDTPFLYPVQYSMMLEEVFQCLSQWLFCNKLYFEGHRILGYGDLGKYNYEKFLSVCLHVLI